MRNKLLLVAASTAIIATSMQANYFSSWANDSMSARRSPNIIVIMLDDVPDNIDFMHRTMSAARSGTRYVNSFVNFSLCGPSRATFLTGQEASTHGVQWDEDGGIEPVGLIPQALQEVGYRTGIFGKKPKPVKGRMEQLGFDRSVVLSKGDGRYFDPLMEVDGKKRRFNGYTIDIVYRWASKFSKKGDKPFFTWIASPSAHAPAIPDRRHAGSCVREPFDPGPAFNEADIGDKPNFLRQVPPLTDSQQNGVRRSFIDKCDVLQTDDEWIPKFVRMAGPDTCVFLTSDNGFLLGEHRLTGKLLLFEESVRVPLIMWGCGAKKGAVERRLVSNTDLPATILELAGAVPGRPLDGRSLFASARSDVRLMGRWGENETAGKGKGFSYGIRQKDWVLFRHDNGEQELYNVDEDPAQELNLAKDNKFSDRRRRLNRLLDLK